MHNFFIQSGQTTSPCYKDLMDHQQFKDRLVSGSKGLNQITHQRVTLVRVKTQILQFLLRQPLLQQLLLQQPHPLLRRQLLHQQQLLLATSNLDNNNNNHSINNSKFEIHEFLSLPMSSKIWNESNRIFALI